MAENERQIFNIKEEKMNDRVKKKYKMQLMRINKVTRRKIMQ